MKSVVKSILRAGVALCALCLVGLAHGATADGTLGATSTGTTDITVTIPDRVQISDLDGIDLGTYSGSLDLSGTEDLCVYRNGTGSYKVQLDSANPGGANEFRMKNGTDYIPYAVRFDDDSDASDGTLVVSGDEVSGLTGDSSSTTCGASDNAQLRVDVLEADLQAAPPASYLDTITLLVTPI